MKNLFFNQGSADNVNVNSVDSNPRDFLGSCAVHLSSGNYEDLRLIVKSYSPVEVAEALVACNKDQKEKFFSHLLNPDVLIHLSLDIKLEVIEVIGIEYCIQLIQHVSGAKIYMFLDGLEGDIQQHILSHLPQETRVVVEELLSYPEGSAGRLIDKDYILLPGNLRVEQVISMLGNHRRDSSRSFYHLFVVDSFLHPIGIVSAGDLLCEFRGKLIADIMGTKFKVIRSGADQEEVIKMFRNHSLFSLAVVDDQNHMVGVIYADEVIDVVQEEAGEDLMHLGGVAESDLHYRIWYTSLKRVVWLFVSFIAINCASLVIGHFGDVLSSSMDLVALIPIIAAMGGNAGLQSTTVAVRSLLISNSCHQNTFRLLYKEFVIGLINGSILAGVMFVVILIRFEHLGIAISFGLSMIALFTLATVAGASIPTILSKLDMDPSLSSSVLTSAITDIGAIYILLKISTILLM